MRQLLRALLRHYGLVAIDKNDLELALYGWGWDDPPGDSHDAYIRVRDAIDQIIQKERP